MTLDEKLDLVSSGVAGIAHLGIPPLAFIDGPNGVSRARPHVVAFPNAIVAATFDRTLARTYGTALGAEAHGTGRTLLGAPTVNILRAPGNRGAARDAGRGSAAWPGRSPRQDGRHPEPARHLPGQTLRRREANQK